MSRAVTDFLYLLKFGRLTRDKSSGDAAGEYVGRDGERALWSMHLPMPEPGGLI